MTPAPAIGIARERWIRRREKSVGAGAGIADRASANNHAGEMALSQFAAHPVGGCRIADRARFDAIIHSLAAEIGTHRDRRKIAQQIGVLASEPFPRASRLALAAHSTELQPHSRPSTGLAPLSSICRLRCLELFDLLTNDIRGRLRRE